ncbi:SOS response-associated peptidase [Pleurocapsa sp. FMAR1]|uniref:SOS response-associated peptidase n=1 Tax=Pleurocapsa sp. FMAR1 TaxID=3040204 RepID=UPI0029C7B23F|nr:SOS response-associated peptidase [Pleurocapsa sp. FMAR1]
MCGRFTLNTTADEIARQFEVEVNETIPPRYNIAPSQQILAIAQKSAARSLLMMKWGLIPSWVKDLDSWKSNLINARVETVAEKPSFRSAFKHRPCLIPTSGFYEWSKDKQPHFFRLKDHQPFALAGLWESWNNGEDELVSCTIITTEANIEVSKVHHRMPVIIQPTDYDSWLGELERGSPRRRQAQGQVSLDRKQLLDALPKVALELYPVSKKVNSPKNDTPDCIKPINSY